MTRPLECSPYLQRRLRSEAEARTQRVQKIIAAIAREQWRAMDGPARQAWKRINEGFATHPVMGRRHICGSCGFDFYDYNHAPEACPDCKAPVASDLLAAQ